MTRKQEIAALEAAWKLDAQPSDVEARLETRAAYRIIHRRRQNGDVANGGVTLALWEQHVSDIALWRRLKRKGLVK